MTPNLVVIFIELSVNAELSTKVVAKGYAAEKQLRSSLEAEKHTQARGCKAHRHAGTRPAAIKDHKGSTHKSCQTAHTSTKLRLGVRDTRAVARGAARLRSRRAERVRNLGLGLVGLVGLTLRLRNHVRITRTERALDEFRIVNKHVYIFWDVGSKPVRV